MDFLFVTGRFAQPWSGECGSGECIGHDKATKCQKYCLDVVIGVQR